MAKWIILQGILAGGVVRAPPVCCVYLSLSRVKYLLQRCFSLRKCWCHPKKDDLFCDFFISLLAELHSNFFAVLLFLHHFLLANGQSSVTPIPTLNNKCKNIHNLYVIGKMRNWSTILIAKYFIASQKVTAVLENLGTFSPYYFLSTPYFRNSEKYKIWNISGLGCSPYCKPSLSPFLKQLPHGYIIFSLTGQFIAIEIYISDSTPLKYVIGWSRMFTFFNL